MRSRLAILAFPVLSTIALYGCSAILGLDDYEQETEAAATGTSATSSTSAGTGGGGGGSGCQPGDPDCACTPKAVEKCYSGEASMADVGQCKSGTMVCADDGHGFGACSGDVLPAATDDCTDQVDDDCTGTYCTECVWSREAGNPLDQLVFATATASDGSTYVTGTFAGTLELVSGDPLIAADAADGYIVKLGADGKTVWNQQLSDTGSQIGTGIAVDSTDHVVTIGTFSHQITIGGTILGSSTLDNADVYLAKLEPNGDATWAKGFGNATGANQFGYGVAVGPSDEIVIVGQYMSSIDFDGNLLPTSSTAIAFVARFLADGTFDWAKSFGGTGTSAAARVAIDGAGNIAVIGGFTGVINFGLGSPFTANATGNDAYLVRMTTSGLTDWVKTFGNGQNIGFSDVAFDSQGAVILAGTFQGTIDIGGNSLSVPHTGVNAFLAKFGPGGVAQWATPFGTSLKGADPTVISRIGVDPADHLVLVGACVDAFDIGANLACGPTFSPYMIVGDDKGTPVWSKVYGGGSGMLNNVSLVPPGFAIVSGQNHGNVDFGKGPLTATGTGTNDIVIAKIATR